MTVKELKDFVNNIDSKYDNEDIIIDDIKYNEYCLGDGFINFEINQDWSYFYADKGFYIDINKEG